MITAELSCLKEFFVWMFKPPKPDPISGLQNMVEMMDRHAHRMDQIDKNFLILIRRVAYRKDQEPEKIRECEAIAYSIMRRNGIDG